MGFMIDNAILVLHYAYVSRREKRFSRCFNSRISRMRQPYLV